MEGVQRARKVLDRADSLLFSWETRDKESSGEDEGDQEGEEEDVTSIPSRGKRARRRQSKNLTGTSENPFNVSDFKQDRGKPLKVRIQSARESIEWERGKE